MEYAHAAEGLEASIGPKITQRQKQHMLSFMRKHPILGFGPSPNTDDYSDDLKKQLWRDLESQLNVLPGVRYDAAGYSQCWRRMKDKGISSVERAIRSNNLNLATQPSWDIYNLWQTQLHQNNKTVSNGHIFPNTTCKKPRTSNLGHRLPFSNEQKAHYNNQVLSFQSTSREVLKDVQPNKKQSPSNQDVSSRLSAFCIMNNSRPCSSNANQLLSNKNLNCIGQENFDQWRRNQLPGSEVAKLQTMHTDFGALKSPIKDIQKDIAMSSTLQLNKFHLENYTTQHPTVKSMSINYSDYLSEYDYELYLKQLDTAEKKDENVNLEDNRPSVIVPMSTKNTHCEDEELKAKEKVNSLLQDLVLQCQTLAKIQAKKMGIVLVVAKINVMGMECK